MTSLNRLARCACLCVLLGVLGMVPPLLAQEEPGQPPPPAATPAGAPTADPVGTPAESTAPDPPNRLRIKSQRQVFSPERGVYQFFGSVSVTKRDLALDAAEMTYDAKQGLITAKGNVRLVPANGDAYRGETLEYRPASGAWAFRDWSTTLTPRQLGGAFREPVFASGDAVSSEGTTPVCMEHAQVTTCDQADPHFAIVARTVDLYPGEKLIARDVDLYVLGKRVARLPWLFFFLRRDRPTQMPEFGRNDVEGYFTRIPFQYLLSDDHLGTLRLDLTEKLGVGLGMNHFYTLSQGNGEAFVYVNPQSGDYTTRWRHLQQLSQDLNLDLSLNRRSQSMNLTTPIVSSILSTRLRRTTDHTQSLAEYVQNSTDGSVDFRTTALNLRHEINTGADRFSYSGEYRRTGNSAGATADDEEMWNRLSWTRRLRQADISLRMDRRTDVDGDAYTGDRRLAQLERMPELTVQTDHARLGWKLPGRLMLGWGTYRERGDQDPLARYLLDWQVSPKLTPLRGTTVQLNAGLRQTVYGDEETSAQYSYRFDLNAQSRFGNLSNTLAYGLQHTEGYSPFTMDAAYARHVLTNALQYQTPAVRLALSAGRDLRWERWHQIALTAETRPLPALTLRGNLAYDPNTSRWLDLVNQLDWANDPRLVLSLRTRYNLDEQRLRSASARWRWKIDDHWQVQWQGEHDGSRFLWNEWMVARDLHCWEALLRINPVRHEFGFTLRPKAFDRALFPEIGVGTGNRWNLGVGATF